LANEPHRYYVYGKINGQYLQYLRHREKREGQGLRLSKYSYIYIYIYTLLQHVIVLSNKKFTTKKQLNLDQPFFTDTMTCVQC